MGKMRERKNREKNRENLSKKLKINTKGAELKTEMVHKG